MGTIVTLLGDFVLCLVGGALVAAVVVKVLDRALGFLIRAGGGL